MELEEKQLVLNASALLIKQFVPSLGWECLPNGSEDQTLFLSKEDIEKVAREVYHLDNDWLVGMNKALCEGEILAISNGKIQLVKPHLTKMGFELNLKSLGFVTD